MNLFKTKRRLEVIIYKITAGLPLEQNEKEVVEKIDEKYDEITGD